MLTRESSTISAISKLSKALANGVSADIGSIIVTSGGRIAETVVIPVTQNAYHAGFDTLGEEETAKLINLVIAANYHFLKSKGVADTAAAQIAYFRSIAVVNRVYPSTTLELRLPHLELLFAANYPDVDKSILSDDEKKTYEPDKLTKEVSDSVLSTWKSHSNLVAEYCCMLVFASYMRQTYVHLWTNSDEQVKKYEKLQAACRATIGSEAVFSFSGTVMRSTFHAAGFFPLLNAARTICSSVPMPLQMRFASPASGAALVPTASAALDAYLTDPLVAAAKPVLMSIAERMNQESVLIKSCPEVFAVHSHLYGVPQRLTPACYSTAKKLAPMLLGWLRSLSVEIALKKQKVMNKEQETAPELVIAFEQMFTAARKKRLADLDLEATITAIVKTSLIPKPVSASIPTLLSYSTTRILPNEARYLIGSSGSLVLAPTPSKAIRYDPKNVANDEKALATKILAALAPKPATAQAPGASASLFPPTPAPIPSFPPLPARFPAPPETRRRPGSYSPVRE